MFMPRPKKPRFVSGYPYVTTFGPLESEPTGEVLLTVEGLEAIRLSDFEQLDQSRAAPIMGVSRQTYGRILGEARAAIADALVTGKLIRIAGGHHRFRGPRRRWRHRGANRMTDR
jgi:predicted DNA-binding protein (UPF0251 family)